MQRKTIRDQILSNLRRQTKAQASKAKPQGTAVERRQRTTTLYG
jgi:hypothetical protein